MSGDNGKRAVHFIDSPVFVEWNGQSSHLH